MLRLVHPRSTTGRSPRPDRRARAQWLQRRQRCGHATAGGRPRRRRGAGRDPRRAGGREADARPRAERRQRRGLVDGGSARAGDRRTAVGGVRGRSRRHRRSAALHDRSADVRSERETGGSDARAIEGAIGEPRGAADARREPGEERARLARRARHGDVGDGGDDGDDRRRHRRARQREAPAPAHAHRGAGLRTHRRAAREPRRHHPRQRHHAARRHQSDVAGVRQLRGPGAAAAAAA